MEPRGDRCLSDKSTCELFKLIIRTSFGKVRENGIQWLVGPKVASLYKLSSHIGESAMIMVQLKLTVTILTDPFMLIFALIAPNE